VEAGAHHLEHRPAARRRLEKDLGANKPAKAGLPALKGKRRPPIVIDARLRYNPRQRIVTISANIVWGD
jgi:hypothetical protein